MIARLLKRVREVAWLLPGFLLWASFPPMGERTDCLFALAPLLWLSRRSDARTSARRWFLNGLLFWCGTLSWMPAIVKNGGPWPLVVLGWGALATYCAAYFAAFGWLAARYWAWARNSGGRTPEEAEPPSYALRLLGVLAVEPLLWCGLELIRSRFLGGFAWNQLGVVPVNSGFGAPAALGGVYLCSAVVVLVNGSIAGIAERVWRPERSGFANLRRLGSLETVLALGLVAGIYWAASLSSRSRATGCAEGAMKVAMVQRNCPCVFRANRENPYLVYDRLLESVAPLEPDLVVLAESALAEFGEIGSPGAGRFAEWVAERTGGAALLAGGSRQEEGRLYNSAALYTPQTSQTPHLSLYDKVHLVPFGEFVPGDKLIPALQRLAPVGSCTPGELRLLEHSGVPFGVAICFEDTDSAQMRELARKGARALFFITNDSWFSHSVEAEQHAWQAVARAIETGLPVVRTGNSGVTGTIAPDGRATWLVDAVGRPLVDAKGTLCDRIAPADAGAGPTPYVRLGDRPLFAGFLLLLASMACAWVRGRRRRGTPEFETPSEAPGNRQECHNEKEDGE